MRQKFQLVGVAALIAASATLAPTAYAGNNDLFGEPAPAMAASRTIFINHDTQYVNLTGGDVVKFIIHGKEYVWDFDVASNINEVDLNQLLPPNVLHHVVKVYLARDPTYTGA